MGLNTGDMTIEDYTRMIEHPMTWVKTPDEARTIKAAILRTIRIVLKDPEQAKEYYGRQPMATMDIAKISDNVIKWQTERYGDKFLKRSITLGNQ